MAGKKKRSVSVSAHGVSRKPRKPLDHEASGGKHSEWERAFWRYSAVLSVMGVLYFVYNNHPYYLRPQFNPAGAVGWRQFYNFGFALWFFLGLPYVIVTRRRFGGVRMDLTDGAVHYLLLFRGVFYWIFEGCRWPRHIWSNRRMRITVLSLGVKAFFTPLMTIFMAEHAVRIKDMWFRNKGVALPTNDLLASLNAGGVDAWLNYLKETVPQLLPTFQGFLQSINVLGWSRRDFDWHTDFYYQLLFFVDCIWALTGYAAESRWLGNKTKSVEPTGFGWMVALMCYPPFNDVSGTYFPLGRNAGWQIITDPYVLGVFKILTLAAFTIYVWATLAFGPTFSNLTNRGIITRGPYAWIRHPAYACKNFAWWMEYLPYCAGGHNLLPLIIWNIIYGLRGWTEERHLSRDPAYREYKKKVRWAAIPGIF
ncbi:MAG: hypothetical protein AB2A00_26920 [Myxococcota bacterium]